MTAYRDLIIGGIEIPTHALMDGFTQDYEELAGISARRTLAGSLLIQRAWPLDRNYLLRTTISGGGSMPPPLDQLDRGSVHEVSCAEARMIAAQVPVIALPAGRRSDGAHAPRGHALVDGELVETSVVMSGDTAILAPVSGAQQYQVRYWPRFTGFITHKSSGDPWQARRTWSLTIEEKE